MTEVLVSIITPSFNQSRFLAATLRSVREQRYPHVEHIVVDGGSTDGTLELLKTTQGLRWISEPDRGQVHAINKGFSMANGEILAWLNSDDLYHSDTVSSAVAALHRTGADMVYGDVEIVDEAGRVLRISRGIPFDFPTLLYGINYIGQQTVFFRRGLLQRAGPLREEFDNGFDYELWLRFAQHGLLVYASEVRAQIRYHATAKSVARAHVTRSDRKRIRAEYWSKGGWPDFFRNPLLFPALNLGYRLRRQLYVRFAV